MSAASAPRSAPPTVGSAPDAPGRTGTIRETGVVRRDGVRTARWTTVGLAKIQGDVDVGSGSSDGLLSVAGKLRAGSFRARGTVEVVGTTEVEGSLALDGTVHFESGLRAGELTSRGTLRSGGPVRVDRTWFARGAVEAPAVTVGVLELSGSAEVPGELSASAAVHARFRGDSRLGTVRARAVELRGPPTSLIPTLWRTVFGGSAAVEVGRVEADSVVLSAVDVGFVHARQIVLGPGAHVTTVEGTVVEQHPTSRIGPESRSPRPHGLSR